MLLQTTETLPAAMPSMFLPNARTSFRSTVRAADDAGASTVVGAAASGWREEVAAVDKLLPHPLSDGQGLAGIRRAERLRRHVSVLRHVEHLRRGVDHEGKRLGSAAIAEEFEADRVSKLRRRMSLPLGGQFLRSRRTLAPQRGQFGLKLRRLRLQHDDVVWRDAFERLHPGLERLVLIRIDAFVRRNFASSSAFCAFK